MSKLGFARLRLWRFGMCWFVGLGLRLSISFGCFLFRKVLVIWESDVWKNMKNDKCMSITYFQYVYTVFTVLIYTPLISCHSYIYIYYTFLISIHLLSLLAVIRCSICIIFLPHAFVDAFHPNHPPLFYGLKARSGRKVLVCESHTQPGGVGHPRINDFAHRSGEDTPNFPKSPQRSTKEEIPS